MRAYREVAHTPDARAKATKRRGETHTRTNRNTGSFCVTASRLVASRLRSFNGHTCATAVQFRRSAALSPPADDPPFIFSFAPLTQPQFLFSRASAVVSLFVNSICFSVWKNIIITREITSTLAKQLWRDAFLQMSHACHFEMYLKFRRYCNLIRLLNASIDTSRLDIYFLWVWNF